MRKTRSNQRNLLKVAGIALVVTMLLAMGPVTRQLVYARGGPSVERYFELLASIPGDAMLRLPKVILNLNNMDEDSEELKAFMNDPRGYLASEEQIELSESEFQITAFNFRKALGCEETVVGISQAPEDEYVFNYPGIGLAYENVALSVQQAIKRSEKEVAPSEEASEGPPGFAAPDNEGTAIRIYLSLILSIPEAYINGLPEVMRAVDRDAVSREDLVENPGQQLAYHDITLPAKAYRIVVFDFFVALKQEETLFRISDIEGEAAMTEGVGFFLENIGLLIQRAVGEGSG